jgi:hypothetical protein
MIRIRRGLLAVNQTKTHFALFAPVFITVGVVMGPAAASKARVGDYQVAYAIDARGLREAQKSEECVCETPCWLKFKGTSIHIVITVDGRQKRHAVVVYTYDDRNCCYFSDGGNVISLDDDKPYHKLPIFEGKKRLGNEFVLNRKAGDIFLAFANFH